MSNKKTVLIIGGGIGGLYAAWKLSKNGFNIKLMEHQTTLGGLSSSIKKDNCYIDIGPHYVSLDSSSEIFDEITNLLNKENIYKISSIKNSYKSFFQGKILDRSPTLSHLIKKNKFFLFRGLIQNIFFKPITITEKTTTDEYLISLYGKSLYNFWCKPILLQTYGEIPPLSKTKNQFEPITIKKIINFLKNNKKIINNKNFNSKTFDCYFKNGMGTIIDAFEKEILNSGGKIILNSNIESIEHGKIKNVKYIQNDKIFSESGDIILYSIPLSTAIKWFNDSPSYLNKKITSQKTSHGILVYLLVDKPQLFYGWILTIYDLSIPFFRITQQTFLSPDVAPTNKTLLCFEIRIKDDNPLWTLDNNSLFELVIKNLQKIFNLPEKAIQKLIVLKLKNLYRLKYYPVSTLDDEIMNYIDSFDNEFALGTVKFDTGDNPSRLSNEDYAIKTNDVSSYGGVYNSLFNSNQLIKKIITKNS